MISPADMAIIQIDVTNACTMRCSNCTRFCGNHKSPFFMSYETFRRAVDSLDGFQGLVSVMGGEPTLHPDFERITRYMQKKFGTVQDPGRLVNTQERFIQEIHRREVSTYSFPEQADGTRRFKRMGACLYSNVGPGYRKYYELIQDTYAVQFLNDHSNPSFHQPGLVSRRDLGIPDEEWVALRDNCWIQNMWSATITPKGAFFCEVAGALDALFDGPGGWEIKPGWWKRTPEEFAGQLHWCELCGFALKTFIRNSDEEIDDVSPTLYEMLKQIGSPGIPSGRTRLIAHSGNEIHAGTCEAGGKEFAASSRYVERYEDRFVIGQSCLSVSQYQYAVISEGDAFGVTLNRALQGESEWLVLDFSAPKERETVRVQADSILAHYVLNPGVLYCGEGFLLFSKRALSLRTIGFDRIAHFKNACDLKDMWASDKVLEIRSLAECVKWRRAAIEPGKRYVIWGMGVAGGYLADAVQSSGGVLAFAVDQDSGKWDESFYGVKVHPPAYLSEHSGSFDYLLIGHYTKYADIRRSAVSLGVTEDKIMMPYEV